MEKPSVKKNFLYKSALTLSTYLISFVTFPYVSRVLGVENIGLVGFADNTVGYFLLFATLGINILGTREIASVKDDEQRRSQVFARVLGVNLLFTAIALAAYFVAVAAIPRLHENADLFYIGASKIVATAFLVEWFFSGVENFRYITLRSVAVKLLYVVGVFLFIKEEADYRLYFMMTMGVVVLNALINIVYASQHIRFRIRDLFSLHYVKDNVTLGIYGIMTSMYMTFNVMYLGMNSDNEQVGYYTTAFKLYTIILGLFSAFANVMMPRMSALYSGGNKEQFFDYINHSFALVVKFIIPLIMCSIVMAPQIVGCLSGAGYEGAVLPMRIIMPAALAVCVAQVLALQIIMPMKHDKVLLRASLCGAVVSLLINLTVVPHLHSVGSAIVLLCSEVVVTTTYVVYITRKGLVRLPLRLIADNVLISLPTVAICWGCTKLIPIPYLSVLTALIVGGGVWIALNWRYVCNLVRKL